MGSANCAGMKEDMGHKLSAVMALVTNVCWIPSPAKKHWSHGQCGRHGKLSYS